MCTHEQLLCRDFHRDCIIIIIFIIIILILIIMLIISCVIINSVNAIYNCKINDDIA